MSESGLIKGENKAYKPKYERKYEYINGRRRRIHRCEVCKKQFKYRCKLQEHRRTHSKKKPFKCSYCGKRFKGKSCQKFHEGKIHSGDMPFLCSASRCNERFKTKRAQTLHQANDHKNLENMYIVTETDKGIQIRKEPEKRSYICEFCQEVFLSNKKLQDHCQIHIPESPFPCSYCDKKFKTKWSQELHESKHQKKGDTKTDKGLETGMGTVRSNTPENSLPCSYCDKTFKTKGSKELHEGKHQIKVDTETAEFCQEAFLTNRELEDQSQMHTSETSFPCLFCDKIFKTKWSKTLHEGRHFKKTDVETDKGIKDGKDTTKTDTETDVAAQLLVIKVMPILKESESQVVEEKPTFSCEICHRMFINRSKLNKHYLVHTREKEFICEVCGYVSTTKSGLRMHQKAHPSIEEQIPVTVEDKMEKKHQCELCNKSFRYKSQLIIHHRVHTGEKPYFCDICGKSYADRSHKISHTKKQKSDVVKEYRCQLCNKIFPTNRALVTHKLVHTRDSQIKCDVCGRKFATKWGLILHEKCHYIKLANDSSKNTKYGLHDGQIEKCFCCEFCPKTFKRSSHLKRHRYILMGGQFVCNICNERFKYKYALKKHHSKCYDKNMKHRLHTERQLVCDICKRVFKYKLNFIKHHRKCHNKIPEMEEHINIKSLESETQVEIGDDVAAVYNYDNVVLDSNEDVITEGVKADGTENLVAEITEEQLAESSDAIENLLLFDP